MKSIVSFSGGKDSTAMLLMMIEKNMPIDEIIFCDTGKEFPAMYNHILEVEKYTGREITIIRSEKSFEDIMLETKGWADFNFRRCTGVLKQETTKKYLKDAREYKLYIGFAADETKRKHQKNQIYPLQEWRVSEMQALEYCYSKGFHWNGLYEKFNRVSCYCCPLQSLSELYTLYNEFPELWEDIKEMDKLSFRQFRSDYSIDDLEKRFKRIKETEAEQIKLNFGG